jgi:branched-chain amino acid transport system permease protein
MGDLALFLVNGVLIGGIYSLVALGVVIIYKTTKIFNFAVGEFVVLGGCVAITILNTGLPWGVGIIVAMLVMGLVGALIQKGIMDRFIGKPVLIPILATCILTYFLVGVEMAGWMGKGQAFSTQFLPSGGIEIAGSTVYLDLMWSFFAAMILFVVFSWIFQRTKVGLGMKAVSEDSAASQSKGVSPKQIQLIAWVIGGVTATVGGIFLGYRIGVNPALSLIGLKAFPIAFLGGLESVPGAIIGGLGIGILENLVGGYAGSEWMDVAPFLALIAVLILRPQGLLGARRVERI